MRNARLQLYLWINETLAKLKLSVIPEELVNCMFGLLVLVCFVFLTF